ncbi:hypothetical protein [Virgisporangium aurantiacum]|uniref:Right handed beta helix domain-containing protein n=1 Tax=Virgisporangium aurantiacum TaxID=175570 RepID=A0A8J3ZNF3_9ACTN|nr:hypothetical protein [Virgisporangium aurantiacum]GIJ64640.1 hypothetical protein Vau01_121560 [Virgisporangium aurantiacum]
MSKKALVAGIVLALLQGFLILQGVMSLSADAADEGTAYFVDNRAGGACSNDAPGTSPSRPWCDFMPVNTRSAGTGFGPGDKVLLARGATWNQQLSLRGTGSAGAPVVVDAYGDGPRPSIIRNGDVKDRGVRLDNPSHWRISNLEVGNAGVGILVFVTKLGRENLTLSDLYLHDITGIRGGDCAVNDRVHISAGIEITGTPPPFGASDYALRKVRITNVEGTRNDSSVSFDWCNGLTAPLDGTSGDGLVRDVELNRLNLHDDNGAGRSSGCEGLRLVNVRDTVVLNSVLTREAACHTPTGTAAVFLGRVRNISIVNSMITAVPDTGSPDQVAVNFETKLENVRVRNNLLADNAGPAVALHAIWGPSDFSTNTEVSGNYFVNNATSRRAPCVGAISRGNNQSKPTGAIRDNVYVEPTGFLNTCHGGDFTGFAVANNATLASPGSGFHAAQQFRGDQSANGWTYQYGDNGSAWSNLTFDQGTGAWRHPSGASVTRFEQQPAACGDCRVARAWTAQEPGTVTVRGRALKSAPDGKDVTARIAVNGATVWGPSRIASGDRQGNVTDIHRLPVAKGDVIRFEVSTDAGVNPGPVSWVPTIGYPANARSWEFNDTVDPGRMDGWALTSQLTGTMTDGSLKLRSSGNDPFMHSPDSLNLDARTVRHIEIRARNGTASAAGEFFFVTSSDPVWNGAKRVTWQTKKVDGDYTIYTVDMGQNPAWTGTIRRLRLDPSINAGPFDIDYIRLY